MTRVDQSLEVTQLDPIEARLLDIDPSSPVLKFQSVSCDQNGRIIEYARTYTRETGAALMFTIPKIEIQKEYKEHIVFDLGT